MSRQMADHIVAGLARNAAQVQLDLERSGLRDLTHRALVALSQTSDPARRKRAADFALGFWLSAAEDDPTVCRAFKRDIAEWFAANAQLNTATKLAKLLAIAQIELRATDPHR